MDGKGRHLVELQRLAVVRELEAAADKPCGLESPEVHVHERPAQSHLAGKLAHVHAAARERGEDPEPLRARQRREDPYQLLSREPYVHPFRHMSVTLYRCRKFLSRV